MSGSRIEQMEWPEVDLAALRAQRWRRTQEWMRAEELDHLILSSGDAIRYVCDVRTRLTPESDDWHALVIDGDGASELFVPWSDDSIEDPYPGSGVAAVRPAPAWAPAALHPRTWAQGLAASLGRAGRPHRVGVEGLPGEVLGALGELLPDTAFVPVQAAMLALRREKLPEEVVLLEAASRCNSRAVTAALDAGRAGVRDYDFLAAAVARQFGDGIEFFSHAVCNVRKPSGDWYPYGAELVDGDAFMFDVGCYGVGGYASDIARTGFVGDPDPQIARAYAELLAALHVGEDLARPGILTSDLDAAVNDYLSRQRLPTTPYAMGHGLGLRLCEAPTIFRPGRVDDDARLRVGDVIALEPETTVELDGKRITLKVEDNYVVEADGLRRLSDARY